MNGDNNNKYKKKNTTTIPDKAYEIIFLLVDFPSCVVIILSKNFAQPLKTIS